MKLISFVPVVTGSLLQGFFSHPIEEAIHKNQPEKVFSYLSHKGVLSCKEKERYLECAHVLVGKLSLTFERTFTLEDFKICLQGLGLASCGLLSLIMAYLIKDSHSNLYQGRVALVVGTNGIALTYYGMRQIYRAITKHYRFLEYYKAVALEQLLQRIPVTS